jgi:hypothetical protein
MMSHPLWITSPAAVDISFGTLALKMKAGNLNEGKK